MEGVSESKQAVDFGSQFAQCPPMSDLTVQTVYEKAKQRYYRDAERLGCYPEKPLVAPEMAVNLQSQVVSFEGQQGLLAAYSFKLDVSGRLRFRPIWAE